LLAGSVKSSTDRAHSKTRKTDLISAFYLHLRSNRTQGMTLDDLTLSKEVLDNSKVREYFGYQLPTFEVYGRFDGLGNS